MDFNVAMLSVDLFLRSISVQSLGGIHTLETYLSEHIYFDLFFFKFAEEQLCLSRSYIMTFPCQNYLISS